ncbi:uncharacterized protein BCR38DRAFT_340789 [Pseudomassariella vexata]|uniref:GPI-anchored cell wall organization protein Ecm33 n=1 Tax=Pseudomassariella vexata TaxID=1141098 RepID=A0A1Y2E1Z7_9PEZI|nr:uncharacterized protein BCR38DRAFT_340789 [Pseudomassariella vexata]ORY65529.1 hypothetical protein BCR38DRAFT_340789 [Pseudomassariella vexata]
MHSKQAISAMVAVGMATGAVAIGCSDATITISSPADATTLASCDTVKGDVVIATGAGSTIDFSGDLTSIGGDLTCQHNGGLIQLSSTSLESIGGAFHLENITMMSTLKFTALESVGSISWQSLTALGELTFGTPGVTKAESVVIADTFLSSLDGINVRSLTDMNINNNRRLTDFSTQLSNLTNVLNINANGLNLKVDLPNLEWIANMTISNVTSFSAQSLAAVNGSMRFDSNYFESVSFPNLTDVQTGDFSFVSNPKLANLTAPLLTKIGGGFIIANNTALEELNGFAKLETVGGAVALRGSFSEISLPALDDVKGTFTATSTGDIQDSCDVLDELSSDGGNGDIQGTYACTSNNTNANNDTSSTGSTGGGTSNTDSGAFHLSSSISTIVTLASLAAMVSAFL